MADSRDRRGGRRPAYCIDPRRRRYRGGPARAAAGIRASSRPPEPSPRSASVRSATRSASRRRAPTPCRAAPSRAPPGRSSSARPAPGAGRTATSRFAVAPQVLPVDGLGFAGPARLEQDRAEREARREHELARLGVDQRVLEAHGALERGDRRAVGRRARRRSRRPARRRDAEDGAGWGWARTSARRATGPSAPPAAPAAPCRRRRAGPWPRRPGRGRSATTRPGTRCRRAASAPSGSRPTCRSAPSPSTARRGSRR